MQRKSLAVGVAGTVAALALGGCGAGSSGDTSDASAGYGGTLHVLMTGTMTSTNDTLEPANSAAQESVDMLPLIMSPLTIYVPGTNPTKIAGDLATSGGESSDGARVWTFHIRHGVKYSDGTQVSSYDVKYAVERSFAPELPGGCATTWNLANAENYKGPFSGKELSSIETPDAWTISFHLSKPNYYFNYYTTSPCTSGVPKAKDTRTKYGQNPVTSGPYKIKSFQGGKSLVLERDPQWKKGLVPAIKAYPDEIDYTLGLDPSVIDQRLVQDQGEDQAAINTDSFVQASDVAQVLNNPKVKDRSSTITLGANEYMLYMDVQKKPFDNPLVRQAMQYAVNKKAFQTATGGPIAGGPIAHSLIGPGIRGYEPDYNPYPAPDSGDPAKAKQLLAKAGYHGEPVQLMMESGTPQRTNEATALKDSLTKAGFNVKLQMVDAQAFFNKVTTPKTMPAAFEILLGGNFNDASQVLGIYDGSLNTKTGPNYDFTYVNDPKINKLIQKGNVQSSPEAAAKIWSQVNRLLMENAAIVPIINESKIYLHGSKVHGEIISNVYGAPSLFNISVSH